MVIYSKYFLGSLPGWLFLQTGAVRLSEPLREVNYFNALLAFFFLTPKTFWQSSADRKKCACASH